MTAEACQNTTENGTVPPPASTAAAWNEVIEQTLLTHLLGQVTCGFTTHRFGSCDWCGAKV